MLLGSRQEGLYDHGFCAFIWRSPVGLSRHIVESGLPSVINLVTVTVVLLLKEFSYYCFAFFFSSITKRWY